MRWLLCSMLLLPLASQAASVLLVPVDEKARALAEELIEPFGAQKLIVKTAGPGSPAVNCLKAKDRVMCLSLLGEKAKTTGVFVVSGGLYGPKGTLTLELIYDGKMLKKETTKVFKGRVKQVMRAPIEKLLKLLPKPETAAPVETPRATITETVREPEPVVADVPVKKEPVALTPRAEPQPVAPLELKKPAPVAAKPKVAAWVFTGLAIAAAGTAGTFGGLGLAGKTQLETAPDGISDLTYRRATALQQTTNTQLTVALGAGIGAGVTGVVAAILWGVE